MKIHYFAYIQETVIYNFKALSLIYRQQNSNSSGVLNYIYNTERIMP